MIYIVNNTGIHTQSLQLGASYIEISFEQFKRFISEHYTEITSLIGHDAVIEFLDNVIPGCPFKVNRVTSDYKDGDMLIGMKPKVRLPEVHDFHSSFLSHFYKYYFVYLFELETDIFNYAFSHVAYTHQGDNHG
jgi:hypothetical protein